MKTLKKLKENYIDAYLDRRSFPDFFSGEEMKEALEAIVAYIDKQSINMEDNETKTIKLDGAILLMTKSTSIDEIARTLFGNARWIAEPVHEALHEKWGWNMQIRVEVTREAISQVVEFGIDEHFNNFKSAVKRALKARYSGVAIEVVESDKPEIWLDGVGNTSIADVLIKDINGVVNDVFYNFDSWAVLSPEFYGVDCLERV